MISKVRRVRASRHRELWLPFSGLVLVAVAAGGFACSVKLDPTIAPPPVDSSENSGGAGGAPEGEPNPSCEPVDGTSGRFVVCPAPLTEPAASADCTAQGGHLASVRSQADNDAITEAGRNFSETTNTWLGGERDEAHFWSWPDGTIFWHGRYDGAAPDGGFQNFGEGEPNNTASTDGGPESCLVLVHSSGVWNDRACDLELSYVCELGP
jgi:hypothetical protein